MRRIGVPFLLCLAIIIVSSRLWYSQIFTRTQNNDFELKTIGYCGSVYGSFPVIPPNETRPITGEIQATVFTCLVFRVTYFGSETVTIQNITIWEEAIYYSNQWNRTYQWILRGPVTIKGPSFSLTTNDTFEFLVNNTYFYHAIGNIGPENSITMYGCIAFSELSGEISSRCLIVEIEPRQLTSFKMWTSPYTTLKTSDKSWTFPSTTLSTSSITPIPVPLLFLGCLFSVLLKRRIM